MPENTNPPVTPGYAIRIHDDGGAEIAKYSTQINPTPERLLEIIGFCLRMNGYDQSRAFSVRVEDAEAKGYWLMLGPQAPPPKTKGAPNNA